MSLGPFQIERVLLRHFQRHFNRDSARIGKKDVVQSRVLRQPRGQLDGWSVGETAKHDVRHVLELLRDGSIQDGMIVPVNGGPPT